MSAEMTPNTSADASKDVWPVGKAAAIFTLSLSCLFAILDFMDRQVLAALFPYMKGELGFSDSQLGLLVSIVNISIAVFTIPAGLLIDKWSRKYMVGMMTFVWSLATGACYFASSYAHLLVCRFFVGTGEAGYVPGAQSLISASFPERLRSTALGIFVTSIGLGGPIGIAAGAFIAQHWGWRHAFGIVAIPGLIGCFLCLKIKDFKNMPKAAPKAEPKAEKTPAQKQESAGKALLEIVKTPSSMLTFLALAGHNMFASAMVAWSISYLNRQGHMDPATASYVSMSLWFGLSIGHIVTGIIMDKLRKTGGTPRAVVFVLFLTLACFVMEFSAFSFFEPGSITQIVLFASGMVCTGSILPLGYTLTADLNPPHRRGTATGVLTFVQNALGMSIGPLLTGIISDAFGLATGLKVLTFMELFVCCCWLAIRFLYHRDVARVGKTQLEF